MKIKYSHLALFCRRLSSRQAMALPFKVPEGKREDFLQDWAVQRLHMTWGLKCFPIRRPRDLAPTMRTACPSVQRIHTLWPGWTSRSIHRVTEAGELLGSSSFTCWHENSKLCMSISYTFGELSNVLPPQPFSLPLLIIELSFSEFESESWL